MGFTRICSRIAGCMAAIVLGLALFAPGTVLADNPGSVRIDSDKANSVEQATPYTSASSTSSTSPISEEAANTNTTNKDKSTEASADAISITENYVIVGKVSFPTSLVSKNMEVNATSSKMKAITFTYNDSKLLLFLLINPIDASNFSDEVLKTVTAACTAAFLGDLIPEDAQAYEGVVVKNANGIRVATSATISSDADFAIITAPYEGGTAVFLIVDNGSGTAFSDALDLTGKIAQNLKSM